jgi:uncharacterized membrane protein
MSQNSSRNSEGSSNKERWSGNPFAAPGVDVDELHSETGENALLPEPNRLSAGAGITWIREGWALMRGHMGAWIGMGVVWFLIVFFMQLVPFIGPFAQIFLMPVFIAGPMLACRAKEQGDDVRFSHLFAGFSNRMGVLMTLGLLYFLAILCITLIAAVPFAVLVDTASDLRSILDSPDMKQAMFLFLIFFGIFIILLVPVQWLSPQLVALHEDITAWEAIKLVVRGILRNLLPFTVFGSAFSVLGILALIPFGLGLLLLIPLGFCTFYAAYRDIFIRRH